MNTFLFASFSELLGGLLVGIVFGFLLQKAHVTRFSTIVGQLLLKDLTVMRVILTAIAVGSFGLYFLKMVFFDVELEISSTTLLAASVGGGIFGIGMAALGYCPGTCVAALAEKDRNARYGILGMLVGAGIYAEAYSWITLHFKPTSHFNKETLAEYFEISPWIFILALWFIVFLLAKDTLATNWKNQQKIPAKAR